MSNETPEYILRQQRKVTRPEWCTCDDGFWMRALIDPQCHYHSDYGEEIRALLTCAADALECYNLDHLQDNLIDELRKAAV
jgi:hypothetical protein